MQELVNREGGKQIVRPNAYNRVARNVPNVNY